MANCVCRNAVASELHPYPLHQFATYGCTFCLQKLIENGGNVNEKNAYGDLPLHTASRYLCVAIVRLLLNSKSFVNTPNPRNCTPLFLAALYSGSGGNESLSIIKILLDRGANTETAGLLPTTTFARSTLELSNRRKQCRRAVVAFLGIRKMLLSVRDTHRIIGKLLWSTRFDVDWGRIIEEY